VHCGVHHCLCSWNAVCVCCCSCELYLTCTVCFLLTACCLLLSPGVCQCDHESLPLGHVVTLHVQSIFNIILPSMPIFPMLLALLRFLCHDVFLMCPCMLHCPVHLIILDLITLMVFGEGCKLWSFSLCSSFTAVPPQHCVHRHPVSPVCSTHRMGAKFLTHAIEMMIRLWFCIF
jgi:hypothetical protein